ncbi:MAG TPA: alkaline phosphatase family protein [Candidatus Eubacterium faecipullorum]|uniref:Alkaline phosphatase family protein n=1 Tax=Candidatus Eubacterium faecipullorum TaxID=2838571 RepID=A0A9D1UGD0_9FIRM|nr:alkaline phosphatase family protein [Candidatus Eubacterium faecipullorum]
MSLSNLITLIGSNITAAVAGVKRGRISNKSNADFLHKVGRYSFWKNTADTSVAQIFTYHHVHDFLDSCEIQNGNAVAQNGRRRKVLFIGFDGMRADALPFVLQDKHSPQPAGNAETGAGGISQLVKDGAVYLAYCGGETGTETEQTTSTSACWTSHFTGVWGNKHGIITNDDSKNLTYKTFMLEYAEKGLRTSLAFDWDPYFDVNLKAEVEYVMKHHLPMRFCDIDRAKKTGAGAAFSNFIAPDRPSVSAPYDTGMRDHILSRIDAGDSVVCGIFHNIDTAGHMYGFGSTQYNGAVISCDMYAYSVLRAVQEREKTFNEQWLAVFANDHGGLGKGHGNQTLEERTAWLATNIALNEKYYAHGYNGFSCI